MCPAESEPRPIPSQLTERSGPTSVLFLTGDLANDALSEGLATLIRQLSPYRFAVELCSLGSLGTVGKELAEHVPTTAHILRHGCDVTVVGRLAKRWANRIDAVVTVGTREPLYWGCTTARWARTPALLSIVDPSAVGATVSYFDRWFTAWSDGLVTAHETSKNELIQRGIAADKVHWIPWGIDTERHRFRPADAFAARRKFALPAGTLLCGLASADGSAAQTRRLLEIVRRIHFQVPHVRFVLSGPPPGDGGWTGLLNLLDRNDVQPMIDGQPETQGLMSAANVYVYLAGDSLGYRPILQAMAGEIPVVVGGGPTFRSLVQSDYTGVLIETASSDAVARHAIRLMTDPQQARRLGERARQHVEKYWSSSQMVRRYEQLICETVHRKRSGPGFPELGDGVEFCGAST